MARALLVVRRRGGRVPAFESFVQLLNQSLTPDNVQPRDPVTMHRDGIATAIFAPNGATSTHGCCVRLGAVVGHAPRWYEVGTTPPEGCYAILRSDPRRVELVADAVASRTIWYVLTPNQLIASTSQRAIVTLLGSFEFNPEVVPWMLSTGTLGPTGGWDARLRRVLPGECVSLDRRRWRLHTSVAPSTYCVDRLLDSRGHARRLAAAVDDVGRALEFEPSRWLLPLSGGVDSRGLLAALLQGGREIRTITWGLSAARHRTSDDAKIARKVAEKFAVSNRYFPVNLSQEPRDRLFHRFLVAGEGRVSNIPPFVDGFEVWKTLYDDGVDGVLRGDQAFGARFVHTPLDVRICTKLTLLSDFFRADELASFELPEQRMPDRLERRPEETLATWRDRLYEQNRLPTMLAGLSELKAAYVEVINPLLFARVLECPRRMPDELRTGKLLWRRLVRSRSSRIPFARRPAVLPLQDFLNDTAMLELMLSELEASDMTGSLGPGLREKICMGLHAMLRTDAARRPKETARGVLTLRVPVAIRAAVRRYAPLKPVLRPTVLAFRVFIVARMFKLLEADARAFAADLPYTANL